jgi:hypothetical protein
MMFSPLKCVKSVRSVQVHAATDVTGFGLQPSGTGCRIPGEKMWLELGNYHGIIPVGYCWLGYGATTMARYIVSNYNWNCDPKCNIPGDMFLKKGSGTEVVQGHLTRLEIP